MDKIKKYIEKKLEGKKVLVLFIITNLVYAYMLLVTIPKTMIYSNELKLLDMMPSGYDLKYINTLFDTLGETGRQSYLYKQIPVDMIYPFLFGISYCLLIAYFLKKINKLNASFFYLVFLPIIAGIADYLENIGIINMLRSYPEVSQTSAYVTNVFTLVKSVTTTFYFIALIIILVTFGLNQLKKRKTI